MKELTDKDIIDAMADTLARGAESSPEGSFRFDSNLALVWAKRLREIAIKL